MQLFLIRHPRPLDVDELCYGRRDVGVAGESLSGALAAVRKRLDPRALLQGPIFSSPSLRCRVLACALAAPREPTLTDDLMEMDFGSWEGMRWDAVPRAELDAWADDVWHYRPGGGESAALMATRWHRWTTELRDTEAGMAIAVTHAGLIRVALRCCGLLSADAFARAAIDFGSIHCIDIGAARVLT